MNKQEQPVRIMVFGTFDVLHPGHLHFFKQARKLAKNPYLIVSIARDTNVKKIKGDRPLKKEARRVADVLDTGSVDEVVLGGIKNHIPHIVKAKPQIIALGYDQRAYTKNLATDLATRGLSVSIVRLKPYWPRKYKSSIIKGKISKNKT